MLDLLEELIANYGSEMVTGILSGLGVLTTVLFGFMTSSRKQRVESQRSQNQFVIDSLREVYNENAADKQDLIQENKELRQEVKHLQDKCLTCEQDKKDREIELKLARKDKDDQILALQKEKEIEIQLLNREQEIHVEAMRRELDVLVSFWGQPERIKQLQGSTGRRNRRFFKHFSIDEILREVEQIPD